MALTEPSPQGHLCCLVIQFFRHRCLKCCICETTNRPNGSKSILSYKKDKSRLLFTLYDKNESEFYSKGIMFFFDSPCFDLTLGFEECEFYPRYYALVRERFIWVYVLIL